MSKNIIALDFDGTLCEGNSFTKLIITLLCADNYSQKASILMSILLRKINLISRKEFQQYCLSYFCGWTKGDVWNWGNWYFETKLKNSLYLDSIAFCKQQQKLGNKLVLISGATDFYLQAVASHMNIGSFISTNLEFKDNKFSGKIKGQICLGEEKKKRLAKYCKKKAICPLDISGYSDSISDLSFLEFIGEKNIVNPNREFLKIAKKRGWPIYYWQ